MKTEVNETQVNFDDVQDYQTDATYLTDSLIAQFPGPGDESDDDIDESLIGDDDLSDTEDDDTLIDDDDDLSNTEDDGSIIEGPEDDSGDIGESDLSVDDDDALTDDDDETQI